MCVHVILKRMCHIIYGQRDEHASREVELIGLDLCVWLRRGKVPAISCLPFAVPDTKASPPPALFPSPSVYGHPPPATTAEEEVVVWGGKEVAIAHASTHHAHAPFWLKAASFIAGGREPMARIRPLVPPTRRNSSGVPFLGHTGVANWMSSAEFLDSRGHGLIRLVGLYCMDL